LTGAGGGFIRAAYHRAPVAELVDLMPPHSYLPRTSHIRCRKAGLWHHAAPFVSCVRRRNRL